MSDHEDQNEPQPEDQPLIPEPVHEPEPVRKHEVRSKNGGPRHCLDPVVKDTILQHVRTIGYHTPSLAAIAGVRPATFLARLKEDPEFDLQIQQARATFLAKLESEAFRRAVDGFDVPMTVAGGREVVKKFSDQLLLHLLKKNSPEKHGDKLEVHQHTTNDAAANASEKFDMSLLEPEERATLRRLLYKARVTEDQE